MTSLRLLAVFWLAALLFSPALADQARPLKGVALVIGQSNYRHLPALANTGNDARAITQLLTALGFEARSVADRDAAKLGRDLERFAEDAEGADVAILYYSGHGIEAGGENYLLPVDADLAALADARSRLVPLSETIERIRQSVPVTILLIDACRTDPFPPDALVKAATSLPGVPIGAIGLGAPKGAVPIENAPLADTLGIVIGYAAEPGRAALDGEMGGTSPYAAALIRHLSAMKGAEFGTVMRMVTEEVYLKTQGRQRPWVNESLRRLLYFGAVPEEPKGDEALITRERRQLLLTIAALPNAERLQVEGIAKDGGIPLDALYGVLRAFGEQRMPEDPDALDKLLREQTEKLKTMMTERQALETDDPEITRLAEAADRAIAEGAIATARLFLDQAVARVDATQGAVDQAEAKLRAKRLADAAVYARRADAAGLALDDLAAGKDYQTAFKMVEKWDRALAVRYKLKQIRAHGFLGMKGIVLSEEGFRQNDTALLNKAEVAFRAAVEISDKNPRASDLTRLGDFLLTRGERANNPAKIKEAITTYRMALAVSPRKRRADSWANTQRKLGLALYSLGSRDGDLHHFNEAVTAFRAALEEIKQANEPSSWAEIQYNLGLSLYKIGWQENGTAHLEEAIIVFREALKEQVRERPFDWARAQAGLGLTLQAIGQRKSSAAEFEEAITCLQNAIEGYRRAGALSEGQAAEHQLVLTRALLELVRKP